MKISFRQYAKYALGFLVFIAAFSLIYWVGSTGFLRPGVVEAKIIQETAVFDKAHPEIRAVMAAQHRHTAKLMAIPEVVGTATGLNEAGRPAILVFAKEKVGAGVIPESLEGVPVVVQVTGDIFAMKASPSKGSKIDPTARFNRPVPIGVSTGNEGECSAGTIGARVKDSTGNVYALSNNHVYALENTAPIDSQVLQPGLYDTSCVFDPNNVIGQLSAFVPINFASSNNTVDAAIALSSTDFLGNATPSNGYGTPNSTTVSPSIYQSVQKYGRTTSLTKGTINGINATVTVNYGSSGTATFVNQIIVGSSTAFIKAGDSGSLLVTYDANRYPIGLLFAGSSSGRLAVANQIGDVLNTLHVTIDGK